jgi:adenine-specific DNA methylase
MKYMGSKRAMLQNGLGHVLDEHAPKFRRFFDLFAGTGSVAGHVAVKHDIPVLAYDLQEYSTVLTGALILRNRAIDARRSWDAWLERARKLVGNDESPPCDRFTRAYVQRCRTWCEAQADRPITAAYGGHYFSSRQAVWIDALRATLPTNEHVRTAALAALIRAASQCAAAPGHTAQPFQPTRTAKKFLANAWSLDIATRTSQAFAQIGLLFAKKIGKAEVGDANKVVREVQDTDLVFIDPPYSGVHYSRFYHVLETIALGRCGEVTGSGRYPASARRPRSKYSVSTESEDALDDLLCTLASRGASALLTFPGHACSNGLSGESVFEMASDYFNVRSAEINSRFSTLGGRGDSKRKQKGRKARHDREEMMLLLRPKR